MKQLDEYFKLQKEIYDYFGYVEDWVVIPIDDRREMYWSLTDDEVHYSSDESNQEAWLRADWDFDDKSVDDNNCYSDEIYTQRFLSKWVYEGKDFTMICVDTHTDGNKFLAIYDNSKRVK